MRPASQRLHDDCDYAHERDCCTLRHDTCDKLLAVDLAAWGDVEVLQKRIHFVVSELLTETCQHVSKLASADLSATVLVKHLSVW